MKKFTFPKEKPERSRNYSSGKITTPTSLHQTTLNILKEEGIDSTPDRSKGKDWVDFIKQHMAVIWACDFFTTEVWTDRGLITHYVLFFIQSKTRKVVFGGINTNPSGEWCEQIAR